MTTLIQVRRGTAAQWTSANPTLATGEIGFETDTGKLKVGPQTPVSWNSLLYVTDTTDFVGVLTAAKGGTGINNSGNTITLGGNLITSGAATIGSSTHTVALNTGNNTSITLPTAGTLATLAGAEALSGKTSYNGLALTALTTGFTVAGGSVTSKTLQVNNTLTLAGTDSTTATMPSFSTTVGVQDLWYANTADVTFASATTSAYNIFKGTTPGTGVALPSAGVYSFMLDVFIQSAESATTHTMNFSIPYSGTMTDINYNVFHSYNTTGLTINSPTSGALMGNFSVATAVPITASVAAAATYYHQIRISGIIRVTTTGNLNPQVAWTVAPTSAPILKEGSHMRITPLSTTSTAISFGTWA
jgi:hypothetical protein